MSKRDIGGVRIGAKALAILVSAFAFGTAAAAAPEAEAQRVTNPSGVTLPPSTPLIGTGQATLATATSSAGCTLQFHATTTSASTFSISSMAWSSCTGFISNRVLCSATTSGVGPWTTTAVSPTAAGGSLVTTPFAVAWKLCGVGGTCTYGASLSGAYSNTTPGLTTTTLTSGWIGGCPPATLAITVRIRHDVNANGVVDPSDPDIQLRP